MKTIILCLITLFSTCKKADVQVSLSQVCGYDKRSTVKTLTNIEGTIKVEYAFTFIVPNNKITQRYIACNLPNGLSDGQAVVFSGEEKEIYPNEHIAGTPLKLTALRKP